MLVDLQDGKCRECGGQLEIVCHLAQSKVRDARKRREQKRGA